MVKPYWHTSVNNEISNLDKKQLTCAVKSQYLWWKDEKKGTQTKQVLIDAWSRKKANQAVHEIPNP